MENIFLNKPHLLSLLLFLLVIVACDKDKQGESFDDVPFSPNAPVLVKGIGPQEGGLGTRIVVNGSNFGNDKTKVKLFFNNKEALIIDLKSTAIYAMVPKQPGELSTIKVAIQTGINSDSIPIYTEAILEDIQFKYNVRATVTTIAGRSDLNTSVDGTPLEATFIRVPMLSVDATGNTIFVSEDNSNKIRMVSIPDNRTTTPMAGNNVIEPWQSDFNLDYSKYFVVQRRAKSRPLLCYGLDKNNNWLDPEPYYDEQDEKGEWIAGNMDYFGLAADDKYVYMISASGTKLIRIDQKTKKVEQIGEKLNQASWCHLAYNPKDKHLYISGETTGYIYRLDPHTINVAKNKPWITADDVKHVVGSPGVTPVEGNGKFASLGRVEAICCDFEGNIYATGYQYHVIWKIDPDLNCTIMAGVPGQIGYRDGKPEESLFNTPYGVSATPDGIVYVADTYNYVVRCIAIQ